MLMKPLITNNKILVGYYSNRGLGWGGVKPGDTYLECFIDESVAKHKVGCKSLMPSLEVS